MKPELHAVDLDLSQTFEVAVDPLYLYLGLVLTQLMQFFWNLREVFFEYKLLNKYAAKLWQKNERMCVALVWCNALAPTGGRKFCFSSNWWTEICFSSNWWTICALAPTGGHPLALDLDCAEEACRNWLRVLDHFHQLCCLLDEIICLWACFWNSELILIKTNVDHQAHDCTNKIHNQPDNFPEVWCEVLDSPSCLVESLVESHTLMMLSSIFWMDWGEHWY